MNSIVFLNGRLVPRDEARVSALDYGFLYGYGVFETMRACWGRVFLIERHLRRLAASVHFLGIQMDAYIIEEGIYATMHANGLSDARLRVAVSAGEGKVPPDMSTCGEPTVLIMADAPPSRNTEVYEKGYRAVVSRSRRNSQSPLSRLKTASYLESVLAREEAREAGVDEAVFLNENGYVAEASMSNLFIVKGGRLLTPSIESGALPGITREAVLEIAASEGIAVSETTVFLDDLLSAQEAFLTSAGLGVMPLVQVDGRPVGTGRPGPVTGRLMAAYRRLIEVECGGRG